MLFLIVPYLVIIMITNMLSINSNLVKYIVTNNMLLYPEVVWKTVITLQDILVIY